MRTKEEIIEDINTTIEMLKKINEEFKALNIPVRCKEHEAENVIIPCPDGKVDCLVIHGITICKHCRQRIKANWEVVSDKIKCEGEWT